MDDPDPGPRVSEQEVSSGLDGGNLRIAERRTAQAGGSTVVVGERSSPGTANTLLGVIGICLGALAVGATVIGFVVGTLSSDSIELPVRFGDLRFPAAVTCAIFATILMVVISRQPDAGRVGTFALLLFLGVLVITGLSVFFSVVLTDMAHAGLDLSYSPPTSALTVGELHRKFVFEVLGSVPLLEVPKSLGWEDPIPDPALPLGAAVLITKAVAVFVVVAALARSLKARHSSGDAETVPEIDSAA